MHAAKRQNKNSRFVRNRNIYSQTDLKLKYELLGSSGSAFM
jgi:hypothetical protein